MVTIILRVVIDCGEVFLKFVLSSDQFIISVIGYLTGSNWLWWSKQTERQQVRSPARGRRLSFNGKIETEHGKYMIQSSDPIIQYSLDIPIFQWDTLWQCHHSNPGSLLLLHYYHYCPYCGHYFKFHQVYYIGLLVSLFSCVKASLVVLVFRFLLMVWIP